MQVGYLEDDVYGALGYAKVWIVGVWAAMLPMVWSRGCAHPPCKADRSLCSPFLFSMNSRDYFEPSFSPVWFSVAGLSFTQGDRQQFIKSSDPQSMDDKKTVCSKTERLSLGPDYQYSGISIPPHPD